MAETMKSIFRQRKIEGKYILDFFAGKLLQPSDRIISDNIIGKYDIDIPLLEKGEEFFLKDIEKVVEIKSRMRSSDGTIVYYVQDEIIVTDNTEENFKKTYIEKEKYLKLQEEFDQYKKEYKYKHIFFNFK